jgi:hypothetical protein
LELNFDLFAVAQKIAQKVKDTTMIIGYSIQQLTFIVVVIVGILYMTMPPKFVDALLSIYK